MKSNKKKEIYCLDDSGYQEYLSSNLSGFGGEKDYTLEDIYFSNDGIDISVRVDNLYNSDSYIVRKFVA